MNEQWNEQNIKKFEEENSELLKNNLVAAFLKNPSNKRVYWKALSNPTVENMNELDTLFKHFYFKIRFISHISTTLKFNSINFDKQVRLLQSRVHTTLDAQISSEESNQSFLDLISNETDSISLDLLLCKEDISQQISYPLLHEALQTLTPTQKQIINLAYVEGLNDTEIGNLLKKSQQAISKTHRKALKKLLEYIESNNEKQGG